MTREDSFDRLNTMSSLATNHTVVIGDARFMGQVEDCSVQLVVTSPPYWQLKDYGSADQIGYNDSYEDYINNLNAVWHECFRVLQAGCRLCVNVGDQFARAVYYGRYKVIPIRTEIIRFCETVGFDYMGAIIWQKPTTMNTTGGASVMGSFPYPRNGIVALDYEFILLFKKQGRAPAISREVKEQSKLSTEEWRRYFCGHWNFGGAKQQEHLAMFPEELPRRLIKMFSFVGDTVLDPFLGSGTTTSVAKQLRRHSIGFEINARFLPMIKQKIGADGDLLSEEQWREAQFEFVMQPPQAREHRLAELPYRFKDVVRFRRQVDPKQMRFGSKIDTSNTA